MEGIRRHKQRVGGGEKMIRGFKLRHRDDGTSGSLVISVVSIQLSSEF